MRGAIGYRSLRLAGLKDGQNLGLTGFGASAHLVLKMVRKQYPRSRVFVFARTEPERALRGNSVRPGLARRLSDLRKSFTPSSIQPRSGRRSSRHWRISKPAGDW